MDQEKFERMMAEWAEKEERAMPELRPTREMYRKVKAKRQGSWFPVLNRWATVSVAALALIVSILVLRPQFFQPRQEADLLSKKAQVAEEAPVEARAREHVQPSAAPSQSDAPPAQREKVMVELEELLSDTQDESAAKPTLCIPVTGDERLASGVKKEERDIREGALPSGESFSSMAADDAQETAFAPEPASVPLHRQKRVRMLAHEDEAPEMMSVAPQAPSKSSAPGQLKGRAEESPALVGDILQEDRSRICRAVPSERDDESLSKVFDVREDVWIDRKHDSEKILVPIKRGSPAFHDLLTAKPELRKYTARYERLIINLGTHSVKISETGKQELSPDELHALFH